MISVINTRNKNDENLPVLYIINKLQFLIHIDFENAFRECLCLLIKLNKKSNYNILMNLQFMHLNNMYKGFC